MDASSSFSSTKKEEETTKEEECGEEKGGETGMLLFVSAFVDSCRPWVRC